MEVNEVIAPQKNAFETVKKLNRALIILELIGVLVSASFGFLELLSGTDSKFLVFTNGLSISSVIVATLLFVTSQVTSSMYQKSEEVRRAGFLDNALGCRTALTGSKKYYDNDDTVFGFKKLLLDLHENSFFTSKIAHKMLLVRFILLLPVSVLMVCIFIVGLKNVAWGVLFLSFLLSSRLITQFLRLCDLYKGSDMIEQDCRRLYEHINYQPLSEISAATHEIIRIQTNYDVLLSRCEIVLSTKIYTKLNESLTLQWNDIKARFSE